MNSINDDQQNKNDQLKLVNYILTLLIVVFVLNDLSSQPYFKKTIGGAGEDIVNSSAFINNSQIIVVGSTTTSSSSSEDGLIMKIDTSGTELWSKSFGGNGSDIFNKVIPLALGGYLAVGYTNSFGAGNYDGIVVKFDASDKIVWSKTFGGTGNDRIYTVLELSDRSLLISGYTESFGVQLRDIMLIKLNNNGNIIWAKTYGQAGNDWAYSTFLKKSNGNYLIGGAWTLGYQIGGHNGLLMELNSDGQITSSGIYGGSNNETFNGQMFENNDMLHVFSGTWSWNGHLQIWMNKLDNEKNITSSKTFGITGSDFNYSSATQLDNKDYIVSAYEISNNPSNSSILMRVNSNGSLLQSRSYGDTGTERILSIISRGNDLIMAFGYTEVEGNKDILIIKTNLQNEQDCSQPGNVFESVVSPSTSTPNSNNQNITVGQSISPTVTSIAFNSEYQCFIDIKADFNLEKDTICINNCISIMDMSYAEIQEWDWQITGANLASTNDQNPWNICFNKSGTQSIKLIVKNAFGTDSISKTILVIPEPSLSINLQDKTTLCSGSSILIEADVENSTSILWSTGSDQDNITIDKGGEYRITVNNECGTKTESVIVSEIAPPNADLGDDRIICNEDYAVLSLENPTQATYKWSDGSPENTIEVMQSGIYSVLIENECGISEDSVEITFMDNSGIEISNVFTPNGDDYNEYFELDEKIMGSSLKILDRTGNVLFESRKYENDWNGDGLEAGIYYYLIEDQCNKIYKGWIQILY